MNTIATENAPDWVVRGGPRVPDGRRVYAIGDVHGRFDLLEALVRRVIADLARFPARDAELVLLGDYLSRGAQVPQVLDFLTDAAPRLPLPVTALKGNHEDMALRFLDQGDLWAGAAWLRNGAAAVYAAYGAPIETRVHADDELPAVAGRLREAMPARHLETLRNLAIRHRVGDYLFVHGGLKPGVPLDQQTDHDMMWMREPFLSDRGFHEAFVVHGHTPQALPEIRPNRLNIDTRAYASNILTCVVLDGRERRFIATV